ncbi:MAG: hypothetical protein GY696_14495 [Gammaproteobacteria bacterium]|nr:hypothetical protein [Gammaproteobacteria bacterium]
MSLHPPFFLLPFLAAKEGVGAPPSPLKKVEVPAPLRQGHCWRQHSRLAVHFLMKNHADILVVVGWYSLASQWLIMKSQG